MTDQTPDPEDVQDRMVDPEDVDWDAIGDDTRQPDSINEFAVIGDWGFKRLRGPFQVSKHETVWTITVTEDGDNAGGRTVQSLVEDQGETAALIADGEVIGGGVIVHVAQAVGGTPVQVSVDQYQRGDPVGGSDD